MKILTKKIKIRTIRPNPFRIIERYPIREEKVGALERSFVATGIWPVIIGRERDGFVEIPFGHHRKAAWERVLKPDDEIEVHIMNLSDADMIKMMAHENMEEWGTSAIVEIETIAAVVKAYAQGKIELNGLSEKTNKGIIRYAPSFLVGPSASRSGEHPYTLQSVGEFLGWLKPNGEAQNKVSVALTALQLIEEGILTEEHFNGLKTKEAENLVRETRARKEQREVEAREAEKEKEAARKKAEQATDREARKLAREQERYHEHKAEEIRKKGREEAARVGKHLSRGMKAGEIAATKAREEASKVVGISGKPRELKMINSAVHSFITSLNGLFDGDSYDDKLSALTRDAIYMDSGLKEALVMTLDKLMERIGKHRKALNRISIKSAKEPQHLLSNGQ
jgi:hypothetical protein